MSAYPPKADMAKNTVLQPTLCALHWPMGDRHKIPHTFRRTRCDRERARAEAERDRFFAGLEMRRSGASSRPQIGQASCQRRETVRR